MCSRRFGVITLLLTAVCAPVRADDAVVSSLTAETCTIVAESTSETGLQCAGVFGIDIFVSIEAGHWNVAFHPELATGTILRQGFDQPHQVEMQVEWRFDGQRPMATIQRWLFNEAVDKPGPVVYVVSKIGTDDTCHMGLIDEAANGDNARQLARDFADETALSFSCESDSVRWIGMPPTSSAPIHVTEPQ